jgi:hypothetical protein
MVRKLKHRPPGSPVFPEAEIQRQPVEDRPHTGEKFERNRRAVFKRDAPGVSPRIGLQAGAEIATRFDVGLDGRPVVGQGCLCGLMKTASAVKKPRIQRMRGLVC